MSSPKGIPMTVDLTGIPCKKVKFLCNKLKLDKPNPKFSLDKASRSADTGCAPVTCKGKLVTRVVA